MNVLAPELIIQVCRLLDFTDILACQATSRRLHSIIQDSVELQYIILLQAAGLDDHNFGGSLLSSADRLHLLQTRERAWRDFSVARKDHVQLPENDDHFRIDIGGFLFFASDRTPYGSLSLPSLLTPNPPLTDAKAHFNLKECSHPPTGYVISVASSEEQDLVVSFTLLAIPSLAPILAADHA